MFMFLDVSLWIWLICLVVGVCYLAFVQKLTSWKRFAYFVAVLAACITGWYLFEPPTPAQAAESLRYALVVLTMTAIPLAIWAAGLALLSKARPAALAYGLLGLWAAAIAWAWPLAVVYMICGAGLECF